MLFLATDDDDNRTGCDTAMCGAKCITVIGTIVALESVPLWRLNWYREDDGDTATSLLSRKT